MRKEIAAIIKVRISKRLPFLSGNDDWRPEQIAFPGLCIFVPK